MRSTATLEGAAGRLRLMAAIAVPALLLAGCRKEAPPGPEPVRTVRAMKVADYEGMARRSFPGRASATKEVDLAFRVSGPLVARPVNIGDELESGDLVARIDPRDFEVSLRNVQAQLREAEAALALAEEQHARGRDADERGALSAIELTRLREAENKARATVNALEASV
ncbi:MAG: efflux RND transporter periplasmic adaptor subunit, partial [Planctomycetota bacterium]